MSRMKPLLIAFAAASALLAGCDNNDNSDDGPRSSTLQAARAETGDNTNETSLPRDVASIGNREDDPETSLPVTVGF